MALKVYLAFPISTTGEATESDKVAQRIEDLGFDVYAAIRNKSINDKEASDPTPMDIYKADTDEIKDCDILVANLTGGKADGTVGEVLYASGLNEGGDNYSDKIIIGYTSNLRALNPQFHKGIPSASLNHLIVGGNEVHGKFVGNEDNMIEHLKEVKRILES